MLAWRPVRRASDTASDGVCTLRGHLAGLRIHRDGVRRSGQMLERLSLPTFPDILSMCWAKRWIQGPSVATMEVRRAPCVSSRGR